MKRVLLTLCVVALLGGQAAYAQLEIGAQVRPRAEYRHGFKRLLKPGEDAAFFIEQRTRVIMAYKKENLKVGISFQDVRIWGEVAQINKSDALTSFHEAFAEYNFTPHVSIKAGRQELDYDDSRVLGNLDWAAQGRSHDAFLLKYSDSTKELHIGGAYNQNSMPAEPAKLTGTFYENPNSGGFTSLGGGLDNPKYLYYLWYGHNLGKLNYSVLGLGSGWQMPDTTVNYLYTTGINASYKVASNVKLNSSFYYQFGDDRAGNETSAWLGSVNCTFAATEKLIFTLGGDYLSGTEANADPGQSNAFEPLFGTNHKFYGWMDYFYVGNPSSQNGNTVGLIDPYLKTKVVTGKKGFLLAHIHQFISPVDISDPAEVSGTVSRNLGTEIDLAFVYPFSPSFVAKAGYSHLFATESMEVIKGGSEDRTANWAWVMLIFNPSILTIDK